MAKNKNKKELEDLRRKLRKDATPAETTLWKMLRNHRVDNLHFYRQYSIDNYILDFYCPSIKLAIELDGEYHYNCQNKDKDYDRDLKLKNSYGIFTQRFENRVVFENPGMIVDAILFYKDEVCKRGDKPLPDPPLA